MSPARQPCFPAGNLPVGKGDQYLLERLSAQGVADGFYQAHGKVVVLLWGQGLAPLLNE